MRTKSQKKKYKYLEPLDSVRKLGIFMINLIQKYNISRFVTTYMCMCISLMNATAYRHDYRLVQSKRKVQ